MEFSVGDRVHLPGVGTGVIREVRSGGRYLVLVKNASLVVSASQIERVQPRKGARALARAQPTPAEGGPQRAHAPSTIDLHGQTAADAEAAVDDFVNAALLAGLATVRIIHGRGSGRVQQAVHARLRQLPPVRGFHVDPTNPGVTIVQLH